MKGVIVNFYSLKHYIARLFFVLLSLFFSVSSYSQNAVELENAKPGTNGWQLTNPSTAQEIEGYASLTSVNRGSSIDLFVNTTYANYAIDIYRIGWYSGLGGRQIGSTIRRSGKIQVTPPADSVTGLRDCNWTDPYTVNVPADTNDWVSGVYLAKLTGIGTDGLASGKQSYIIFTVRDDSRPSDYLFVSAVNTWQAYNAWGGKSLYSFNSASNKAAKKVSFNRPYDRNNGSGDFTGTSSQTWGGWEINMLRFLERENKDVTYATNVDLHEQGAGFLSSHKGILFQGHDEYWSYQMRSATQQARDAGVNLGFFGANSMYWQVRYEPSGSSISNRTLVGYKEAAQSSDPFWLDGNPANDKFITTRWRDLPAAPYNVVDPVAQPENAVIGVMYHGDPYDGNIIVSDATSWVYEGTNISNGYAFSHLQGYEDDGIYSNGYSPIGLKEVAHSPDSWGYASMTIYPTAAGGVVFAAGSIWWSYVLDDFNVFSDPQQRTSRLDPVGQQTMRNILARFVSSSSGSTTVPAAPTSLNATAGSGGISLSWAASAGATKYNVYRGTASGQEGSVAYAPNITSTSFTDSQVSAGVTYYYQVYALNTAGASGPSNEASATAQAAPPPTAPAAPTGLAASQAGTNVKLTWTQSASTGIASNTVYRADSVNGPYTPIATISPASTAFNDRGVAKKRTYSYQITATDNNGLQSPPSTAVTITTK